MNPVGGLPSKVDVPEMGTTAAAHEYRPVHAEANQMRPRAGGVSSIRISRWIRFGENRTERKRNLTT